MQFGVFFFATFVSAIEEIAKGEDLDPILRKHDDVLVWCYNKIDCEDECNDWIREVYAAADRLHGLAHVVLLDYDDDDVDVSVPYLRYARGGVLESEKLQAVTGTGHDAFRWKILSWWLSRGSDGVRQLRSISQARSVMVNITGVALVGDGDAFKAVAREAVDIPGAVPFLQVEGENMRLLRGDEDLEISTEDTLREYITAGAPLSELNGVTQQMRAKNTDWTIYILGRQRVSQDRTSMAHTLSIALRSVKNESFTTVWMDTSVYLGLLESWDIPESQLPLMMAAPRGAAFSHHWFTGVPMVRDAKLWLETLLNGTAEPRLYLDSAPLIERNESFAVREVVASNFKEIYDGKDVMMYVYASWCEHCKSVAPVLEEFAQLAQRTDKERLSVVKMDVERNTWCKYQPVANQGAQKAAAEPGSPTLGMMQKICFPALFPLADHIKFGITSVPAMFYIQKTDPQRPISFPLMKGAVSSLIALARSLASEPLSMTKESLVDAEASHAEL